MNKRKKLNIFICLSIMTLFLVAIPQKNEVISVSAGPRPTNIDMTTMSESNLASYYSSKGYFVDKKGDQLLASLYNVIKGHNEYNYDSESDRFVYKIIDRNWELSPLSESQLKNFNYTTDNPYIRKLYADYNNDVATADRFKNVGASRVSFDKEHIWAQSMGNFGRDGGAGSDFHALWPADVKGNQNAHSNYNYGVPTSGITTYVGDAGGVDFPSRTTGTYVGRNGNITGFSQKVFEPTDEYKGDIARAMMYMAARYYVHIDTDHPKLTLVNGSPSAVTSSPTHAGLAGNLEKLLEWNEADPVSAHEIKRNNLLYYNYQGNRNPFIDHPEWARVAFDTNYSGEGVASDGTGGGGIIEEEELLSISINNAPNKLKLFEEYDSSSLEVRASYRQAGETIINHSNTNLVIHSPDTSKLGYQDLTVSFVDGNITKYASVAVFVTNENVEIGDVPTLATDLFISEYIEGTSNNKYIEIFNGTGASVNLSDYRLRLYANGGTNTTNDVVLSGTLANNKTIVYKNTNAALTLPSGVTATTNAALNFNGDDAIALYKISTKANVDIFGKIGHDPGTAWSSGGVSTLDKTLVRKSSVYQGVSVNPTTFDPSLEWIQYATDTASNLGSHTMSASSPGISKELQANAWAEYFLHVTNVYCEDLNGALLAGSLWNELGQEYSYMDSTTKALYATTPSNSDTEGVGGAKARYLYLITKYSTLKSNNFMKDGANNVIFNINGPVEKSNNQNNSALVILISLSALLFLFYFLTKKKSNISR